MDEPKSAAPAPSAPGEDRVGPRWVATAAIVAVAVAARVWTWTHAWGLGQDACTYLETARDLLRGAVDADHWPFRMRHPAYPLLIAGGGALGADLEFAARLISVLASGALVGLVHRTWSRWRGGREGFVAALCFAVHPGLALYGGEIWVEPAQMLLLFAVLRGCVGFWESPHLLRRAALLAVGFGLLACFKNNAVFFVPGAALAVLALWRRRTTPRRMIAAAVVFSAVLAPVALAPQIAEYAVRGRVTAISPGADSRLLDQEDRWVAQAAPGAEGGRAAILHSSWRRLTTEAGPRALFPWWLVAPLAGLGVLALVRDGGPARRLAWIAGLSIGAEIVAMTFFGIQDRFLLFGYLALLPVCAAGATQTARLWGAGLERMRAGAPAPSAVRLAGAILPVALLCAVWGRSFVKMNAANAAGVNVYRDAGLQLAALGSGRPRVILTYAAEAAWRAGAKRFTFSGSTWLEVDAAMTRLGCDCVVAGPSETSQCPELREAQAVQPGGTWRGMRVLVRVERPDACSVLVR